MKHLTVEQVRANYWRKQFGHGEDCSFSDIARKNIGLHSTDYWTPYISVWARIGDFDAAKVYQSINRGEEIVRLNAFRTALHLVDIRDFSLVASAVGPKFFRDVRRGPELRLLKDKEVESMLETLIATLEGKRLNMRGLKQSAPGLARHMRSLVLLGMARGLLVRAETSHARSTACTYALARNWLSKASNPLIPEDEATRAVFIRYVEAFGPISAEDFAWWLPTTKTRTKKLLGQTADRIVECSTDRDVKYMSRDDLEIAESLETPGSAEVIFLPYEDHLPKAFRDRSWYIDEALRPMLFPRFPPAYWPEQGEPRRATNHTGASGANASGEIRPSIWFDGRIVGRWEFDEPTRPSRVLYTLFKSISGDLRQRVKDKATDLERFVNARLVPIST